MKTVEGVDFTSQVPMIQTDDSPDGWTDGVHFDIIPLLGFHESGDKKLRQIQSLATEDQITIL